MVLGWEGRWARGLIDKLDRPGNARKLPKPIKSPSCCCPQKFQNLKKGDDNMVEIREPPRTLEEFEKLRIERKIVYELEL